MRLLSQLQIMLQTTTPSNLIKTAIWRVTTVVLLGLNSTECKGQVYILEDTTFNATVFEINPPNSVIVNAFDNPLLTLSGSATTNGIQGFVVGSSMSGSLRVTDGSSLLSFGHVYLGRDTLGSSGTMVVDGVGSKLTFMNSDLYIGKRGFGELSIANGGNVSYGVSPPYSHPRPSTYLGYETGSHGSVTVSDFGSKFSPGLDLFVGYWGEGTLNVSDGAVVDAFNVYCSPNDLQGNGRITARGGGVFDDCELVLNQSSGVQEVVIPFGEQGQLEIINGAAGLNLFGVGFRKQGSLLLSEGIHLRSTSLILGYLPGSHGTAIVRDPGTLWFAQGVLSVGNGGGLGSLIVENGGRAGANYAVFIAQGSQVEIRDIGSELLCPFGTLNILGGVRVLSGAVVKPGFCTIHSSGTVTGYDGIIQTNVVNNGTLAPGTSCGVLTIQGNYTQEAGGKFEVDLARMIAGMEYDQLIVSGNVALDGSLTLVFDESLDLELGQSFDILTTEGTLTGTFSNLPDGSIVGTFDGVDLMIEYHDDGVRLVTPQVPATLVDYFVYHSSWSGTNGSSFDTLKKPAKEGAAAQELSFNHMVNASAGITGIAFDIENLASETLAASDFLFQISPQGPFNPLDHPPANWSAAPNPNSIVVTSGEPSRVQIEWVPNSVENQWLRVTVKPNSNTGLVAPESFYIGHLLGETTGHQNGIYTVSFSDISSIRANIGQSVDAGSIPDIDKNGTVSFADISTMRSGVGNQLSNITVPSSGP